MDEERRSLTVAEKSTPDTSKIFNKIDVHAHFHPPELFEEIERCLGKSEQMLGWRVLAMKRDTFMQTYSIEERLDWMNKFGIDKSVFSFPNINLFMDEIAAHRKRNEMSQFINDFFARTRQKYPTRALFLADVPLGTDPDFSVKELNRAMTQLGLNGVAIQTNNAGKLPHEQIFDDFFSETERLDVPVLLHPGKSPWFDFAYTGLKKYMFESIVGFPADTTITIAYMIIDGFFERHKKSKIILTHLGSTIPYIYGRIGQWVTNPYVPEKVSGKANLTKTILEYLKMFYYDTANGNPEALQLCENILDENKILFGTDHPYIEGCERMTIDYLNRTKITKRQLGKIYSKNATALFKLKT
jgi:predicted TIM-barrel fold metal-dependent hydrolase